MDLGAHFLESSRRELGDLRRLGERALAQLGDADLWHRRLDPESNSVAVLIQHLAGNMRSRWTDFLTTDGEKPDRRRDEEFEDGTRRAPAELLDLWHEGWGRVEAALAELAPEDLQRTVTIRGKPLSVLEAIQRQIAHYALHVGQLVALAKHLSGPAWQSLSIPRRRP